MRRVITPHNVEQSGREFLGCVDSYNTAQCGTVWKRVNRVCVDLLHRTLWQRVYRVCGEFLPPHTVAKSGREFEGCVDLSHRTMWHSLAESLYGGWRVKTPHTLAQYGRECTGCVEKYHNAKCGTAWQRVFRVCGELSHRKMWHSLAEYIRYVESYHPHIAAESRRDFTGCVEIYLTAHFGIVRQRVYRVCREL